MSKVYYISSFSEGTRLHGGTLRTMQIRELLNKKFGATKELNFNFQIKFKSLTTLPSILRPAVLKKILRGLSLAGCLKSAYLMKQVVRCIPKKSYVCLEVCGANSILIGHLLIDRECRIICFPHNIEALVCGVKTRLFHDEFSWLRMELELYRNSKQVFAISSFDHAILRSLNVDAEIFPYFPCSQRMTFLDEIRKIRKDSPSKGDFLLFASVGNQPTRMAVEDFLETFSARTFSAKYNLLVAGRGTEIFTHFNSKRIKIIGDINEESARLLQQKALFSVVPVIQTTGFLTKLVENNLMGLPTFVIGSYIQASSLEEYGIFMKEKLLISDVENTLNNLSNNHFRRFQRTEISVQF